MPMKNPMPNETKQGKRGPVRRFEACTIPASATLRDGMRSLETSALEICLVVDPDQRLVGTLTDGDIRRALLGDGNLETLASAAMQKKFSAVAASADRTEVLELMNALRISQVPIVDANGKLEGLHTLHDIVGVDERPNTVVIMAGGKGTRLAPYTRSVPKPMLRVAGRPILERLVLHLVGAGFRRITIALNYLGETVEDHFLDGSRFGCRIRYLREERPLGTAGALSLLTEPLQDPVLVMNGDLVTQADFGSMMDFHAKGGQIVTVATRRYVHTVPFGCVDLDEDRVLRFDEKPTFTQMISAGIYSVAPEVLTRLPKNTPLDMPDVLAECISRGELVRAFEVDDDWIDVGQVDQLRRARGEE